jgi:D-xylose transport system permease protein
VLALHLWKRYSRSRHGLSAEPRAVIAIRIGTLAVLLGGAVWALNLERSSRATISQRGVPMIVLIVGVLLVLCTFVLNRTAFGRHIYAVGGNREAARRAGIHVDAIRISVFVICSTMAAVGGIVAASRDASVNPNTGGSNVLLYAVGAAVIGGTSLFGGKGRVLNAILGGAVVAVIENGMGLMNYSPGTKYVVTGVVLLLAAGIDALTRRRATAAGLR